MVPWNSASGGFTHNWQSKGLGRIAIKTEKTQIHILRDVFVAVASLDLKVPNYLPLPLTSQNASIHLLNNMTSECCDGTVKYVQGQLLPSLYTK